MSVFLFVLLDMVNINLAIQDFITKYFELYGGRDVKIKSFFLENFSGLDGITPNIYNYNSWLKAINEDFNQIPIPFDIKIQNIAINHLENALYTVTVVSTWDFSIGLEFSEIGDVRSFFILKATDSTFKINHLSNSISLSSLKEGELFPVTHFKKKREQIENEIKSKTEQLNIFNEQLVLNLNKLEKANDDLEQFTKVAAHDLKSPLISTKILINKIINKYENSIDNKDLDLLKFCVKNLKSLTDLITNTLQLYTKGAPSLPEKHIDTNLVAQNIKQELELETNKELCITYYNLPKLKINKSSFTQLLTNILRNSISNTKKGIIPKINISCKQNRDKSYTFCVADNGIGIADSDKELVFQIYFKSDRNKKQGHGIGLAVCKKIVELYNGSIWIKDNEEHGTSVYFTLKESC